MVMHPGGDREWYVNARLHKLDAPAIILEEGGQSWWFDGRLHREDGPAVTHDDGRMLWYHHGRQLAGQLEET